MAVAVGLLALSPVSLAQRAEALRSQVARSDEDDALFHGSADPMALVSQRLVVRAARVNAIRRASGGFHARFMQRHVRMAARMRQRLLVDCVALAVHHTARSRCAARLCAGT